MTFIKSVILSASIALGLTACSPSTKSAEQEHASGPGTPLYQMVQFGVMDNVLLSCYKYIGRSVGHTTRTAYIRDNEPRYKEIKSLHARMRDRQSGAAAVQAHGSILTGTFGEEEMANWLSATANKLEPWASDVLNDFFPDGFSTETCLALSQRVRAGDFDIGLPLED